MTMFNKVVKEFQWGGHKARTETGEIVRQVSGVMLLDMDSTVVLATMVDAKNPKPGQDFFPLTVDYLEKTYAAGKILGDFFKREGRPSENEILTPRLIDRLLCPLFPEGSYNEVQVMIHVLSVNPEVPADTLVLVTASAALAVSGLSFSGPVGAARVGYKDDQYLLNPNRAQLTCSDLDLAVAGTERAVLMVESEAQQLLEEAMLGVVVYGHEQMQIAINTIHELVRDGGKSEWDQQAAPRNEALVAKAPELGLADLQTAYQLRQRSACGQKFKEVYKSVVTKLVEADVEADGVEVDNILFKLESKTVRGQILNGELRIDGRDTHTVCLIEIRSSVLLHAYGSALFMHGEAQVLVVTTLGTKSNEQIVDVLQGEYRDCFMLHYNTPPFATGETGRVGGPKCRGVDHGRLAKCALIPVLSKNDEFTYTIRLVSGITELNGSSSMASVCDGSLALMDAGVPLKVYVTGVAVDLVLEDNKFAVLTDILDDEDHLGDMDFRVAGTDAGITALQMDIEVWGITEGIMQVVLAQTKEGCLHVLGKMQTAMGGARTELSEHAPHMITVKINPEKTCDMIGKGGSMIQALTKETGCTIDIQGDSTITIVSTSSEGMAEAKRRIEGITAEAEVGKVYSGTVLKLLDFGAIVNILPGEDGSLHILEIANERVNQVSDYAKEGQAVRVKLLSTDEKGRIRLSIKAAKAEEGDAPAAVPQASGASDAASQQQQQQQQ